MTFFPVPFPPSLLDFAETIWIFDVLYFFLSWSPSFAEANQGTLWWTYQLPGGHKSSFQLSLLSWGNFQPALTLILLQKYRDTNRGVSWYKLVVYILLSAKKRAYFGKSIAIAMGGVSRYFQKYQGQGSIWFSWFFSFCRISTEKTFKLNRKTLVVRPEKWVVSQVGFRGSNASGGRIVLLPGACWAHGASKMAGLGASLLLCISQRFRA